MCVPENVCPENLSLLAPLNKRRTESSFEWRVCVLVCKRLKYLTLLKDSLHSCLHSAVRACMYALG